MSRFDGILKPSLVLYLMAKRIIIAPAKGPKLKRVLNSILNKVILD